MLALPGVDSRLSYCRVDRRYSMCLVRRPVCAAPSRVTGRCVVCARRDRLLACSAVQLSYHVQYSVYSTCVTFTLSPETHDKSMTAHSPPISSSALRHAVARLSGGAIRTTLAERLRAIEHNMRDRRRAWRDGWSAERAARRCRRVTRIAPNCCRLAGWRSALDSTRPQGAAKAASGRQPRHSLSPPTAGLATVCAMAMQGGESGAFEL